MIGRAEPGIGMVQATDGWSPWGKLSRLPDGDVLVHPLLDHMVDVAAVLDAILMPPAVERALATAAVRPLTDVDRARLTVLTFLHDIGKANSGFQDRLFKNSDRF